jgi:hypothetical protein
MIVKWLNKSKNVKSAVEYVLSEVNSKNQEREELRVLRGDPELLLEVAREIKRKHVYSSAVIAFHPDEVVTNEVIEDVLDSFEKVMGAYAGVADPRTDEGRERLCWVAVWHKEGDNRHVHVIALRHDLKTGLSVNPAPPGWEGIYGLWRRYMIAKHDLIDPDATEHKRVASILPPHAERSEWLKDREKAKEKITEYVITRLLSEGEYSREKIVKILSEIAEVSRVSEKYISVKIGETKLRLKGGIYDANTDVERLCREIRAEKEARNREDKEDRRRELSSIQKELEEHLRRIFVLSSKRLEKSEKRIDAEFEEGITRERKEGSDEKLMVDSIMDRNGFVIKPYGDTSILDDNENREVKNESIKDEVIKDEIRVGNNPFVVFATDNEIYREVGRKFDEVRERVRRFESQVERVRRLQKGAKDIWEEVGRLRDKAKELRKAFEKAVVFVEETIKKARNKRLSLLKRKMGFRT